MTDEDDRYVTIEVVLPDASGVMVPRRMIAEVLSRAPDGEVLTTRVGDEIMYSDRAAHAALQDTIAVAKAQLASGRLYDTGRSLTPEEIAWLRNFVLRWDGATREDIARAIKD